MLALFAALALAVSQQGVRPEDDPELVNRERAGGAEIADPTEVRPHKSAQGAKPAPKAKTPAAQSPGAKGPAAKSPKAKKAPLTKKTAPKGKKKNSKGDKS